MVRHISNAPSCTKVVSATGGTKRGDGTSSTLEKETCQSSTEDAVRESSRRFTGKTTLLTERFYLRCRGKTSGELCTLKHT